MSSQGAQPASGGRRRNAVVTGAGRNIGRAVAMALAEAGMGLGLVDLDGGSLAKVQAEISAAAPGVPAPVLECDVTEPDEVAKMASRAASALGSVDALVNNVAATDRGSTILDLPVSEWHRVLDASLTSTFLCSQHIGRLMVRQGTGGVIINIGSTSGYLGRGNATAYPAAKSALVGLTRAMARQLSSHGIRVNLVAPNKAGSPVGQVERKPDRSIRNLVGRPGEPEDIARVVRFLISDEAGFIDGADLLVDGGAVLSASAD